LVDFIGALFIDIKGALNPNFLNLNINREKYWLQKRFGHIS